MLCASRERQHTISAKIRRSAGLLHLVCIPQPPTGGSDLWKIPPLRHSGLMKAEIKGEYRATVWNRHKKKGLCVTFDKRSLKGCEESTKESSSKYTGVPEFH